MPSSDTNKFKREIGLFDACAITIGGIVGTGIFIAPKGVVIHVGSAGLSLVMWVFNGFLSSLAAFTYSELATMFPSSGGRYTYLYEAFGPLFAFLSMFTSMLIFRPIGNAILSLSFAQYAAQPFYPPGCAIPTTAIQLIAASAICLLSFINCCDVSKTTNMITGFVAFKVTALLSIIAGGIYTISIGNVQNFDNIWENSNPKPGSLVLAAFSGAYAYGGWSTMTQLMEELKEPQKNFPRAVVISLGTVTIIYVLTNAAYFSVMTPAEMLSSHAVASTFVAKVAGKWGWLVPIFVSISILGTLSIRILGGSRAGFVAARWGQLPEFMALLTVKNKSPVPATMFQSTLSFVCLLWPDVFKLMEFSGIIGSFYSMMIVIGLFYLRWKRPDIPRPFRVYTIIPAMYLLLIGSMFVIPIYTRPVTTAVGACISLSGIPIYFLLAEEKKGNRVKWVRDLSGWITEVMQKLLLAVKEDAVGPETRITKNRNRRFLK